MSYRKGENLSCCPVCGKQYYAGDFRLRWDGLFVCRYDYEERHPQDFVRGKADNMQPAVVAGCCGADGAPQIATSDAPLCPFPLEPLDNAVINNATSVNLSFSTFPGVTSYLIYFWEDGETEPTSPTYTTTSSPYFVTGLTENTGYRWYVNAANADEQFRDCSGNARFFTTALPLLACPELVSPSNNFLLEGDSITLEWQAVAGATSYNVYLFVENQPRQLLTSTESTSYEASGLALGVDYFWTVTAVNASGESVSCGLRGFSTENTVVLSASSYLAYENEGFATVVLLRSGTVGEVTADYATSDGTATAPANYSQTTGTATWPNGDEESIPVQIPIEPIEQELEYSNYVLYPWTEGSNDPRACLNDHEYAFLPAGGTAGTYGTYEAAKAAAEAALGYSLSDTIIGWSKLNDPLISDHDAVTAGERQVLVLRLNHALIDSVVKFFGNITGFTSGSGGFNPLESVGVVPDEYVWWSGNSTSDGYDISGIYYVASTGGAGIPTVPSSSAWATLNNCIPALGCAYAESGEEDFYTLYRLRDVTILCRRKIRAPDEPCFPRCSEAYPDYEVDSSYCVISDVPTLKDAWTLEAGEFKVLTTYATGGSPSAVTRYPLNATLPSTDPNYSNEAFWTAQRDAAVLAGFNVPSTYSSTGENSPATHYPVKVSAAFVRGPIKPIRQFTISLSNPTGGQLGTPDEATITILPST